MSERSQAASGRLSRRRFLQITAAAGAVFLGGRWLQRLPADEHTAVGETRLLMGTLINLTVVADDAEHARQAIQATFAEMERLVALFDWRRPESPLAVLNRTSSLAHPPADLADLLQRAYNFGELTGGAFDPTIQPLLEALGAGADPAAARRLVDYRKMEIAPRRISLPPRMRVTLDGIAKGRVVDGAVAILDAYGYENVLVEAGGDLVARGRRVDGQSWRVGITHPRQENAPLDVLTLSGQAVATSGDYRHAFTQDFAAHHIVDPRRGVSPAELAGATVLAPTAAEADGLSTALMVLGSEAGLALMDRLPDVAAVVVTKEMEIMRSAALPAA